MICDRVRPSIYWNSLLHIGQRLIRSLPSSLASSSSDIRVFSSFQQPFQSIVRSFCHESLGIWACSLEKILARPVDLPVNGACRMRGGSQSDGENVQSFCAFGGTPELPRKVATCQSSHSFLVARLFSHTSVSPRNADRRSGFYYYTKGKSARHRSFLSKEKNFYEQRDSAALHQSYGSKLYHIPRRLRPQAVLSSGSRTSRVGNRLSTVLSSASSQLVQVADDLDAEAGSQGNTCSAVRPRKLPVVDDWERHGVQPDENHYDEENDSSLEDNTMEQSDVYIPVEAFFIARSVDLKSLSEEPFVEVISCRKHLVIRCRDHYDESFRISGKIDGGAEDNWSLKRYMVVFQWGSVVLFNFGSPKEDDSLDIVKKHCKDIFKEEIKENYGVLVRPTLDRYSQGGPDKIMVKTLDTDGLRIISLILSQSIALDHYTKAIDCMLTSFGELNRTMEMTGNFKLHRKELFQLVAAANTTLADAILRIGLLERSDVAWQNANYDRIWGYLREDFELDERFESLEFKTGIIQHNVKFFLDILQNRKSDLLEWIIIFLIAGEIMVSLYDILHGTGAL